MILKMHPNVYPAPLKQKHKTKPANTASFSVLLTSVDSDPMRKQNFI